jgi:hypothetical protein
MVSFRQQQAPSKRVVCSTSHTTAVMQKEGVRVVCARQVWDKSQDKPQRGMVADSQLAFSRGSSPRQAVMDALPSFGHCGSLAFPSLVSSIG